jgi:hypothetical protein
MKTIVINGVRLHAADLRADEGALARSVETEGSIVLIGRTQPITSAQRERLERSFTLLESVPGGAYVARSKAGAEPLETLEADLPVLLGDYHNGFKVAPAWDGARAANDAVEVATVPHRDVTLDNLALAIRAVVADADIESIGYALRVRLRAGSLSKLAELPQLRNIEHPAEAEESDGRAASLMGTTKAVPAGFDGSGEVIAVSDSGFDIGTADDVHPAFAGRVVLVRQLGDAESAADVTGHGTLVASCALGSGSSATVGNVLGVAPHAKLVFQSLRMQNNLPAFAAADVTLEPPCDEHAAFVHNLSINDKSEINRNNYSGLAKCFDEVLYRRRDIVLCVSAGNMGKLVEVADGVGALADGSMMPPATAKNVIAVGASENQRPEHPQTYGEIAPGRIKLEPYLSDRIADGPSTLVPIGSRGPTSDGRIKPDVVAPGTHVLGAKSRFGAAVTETETADDLYAFKTGTSFSSAFAAGACAVIRQWLRVKRNVGKPSAALVKAILINGAQPLPGEPVPPAKLAEYPSSQQGFGRVDIAASLVLDGGQLDFADEGVTMTTGSVGLHEVILSQPSDVVVTLVWSDPPGEGLSNDLDLVVKVGDERRHGNMPPSSTEHDRANNVEQVRWAAIGPGALQIEVHAYDVPMDPQSYALVWSIRPKSA